MFAILQIYVLVRHAKNYHGPWKIWPKIYNFFKSSSKRQSEFKEFQAFMNLEPHKILHPSQTRWLSLSFVVDCILEQWDSLKLYFTDTYLSHRLLVTEQIYHGLNDIFMKLGYYFLSWALPLFTK